MNKYIWGWDSENKIPNPGSLEAIELGCQCPRLDNNRGQGINWDGHISWYMSMMCKLHTKENEDGS